MKKRTAIITIICIGILSVSVAALAGSETISSAVSQLLGIEEQVKEPVQPINNEVQQLSVEARASQITQQLTNRDFISLLESKGYYIDEINTAMEDYIRLSALYDFTDEQTAQFYQLVSEGYDFARLLEAFEFAQDTDHPRDIGYAKQIYDKAEQMKIIGTNWAENAFNALTNERGGILTEGEIQKYIKQGITIDEIATANIMSRRGTRSVQQILDGKVSGKTWAEVAEEV